MSAAVSSLLLELARPEELPAVARQVRAEQILERNLSKRLEPALTSCLAAYSARFGTAPSDFRERLECLPPPSLRLTTQLVEKSGDASSFHASFELLADTFVMGRLAGARRVLQAFLERRFGPLSRVLELALETADAFQLDACFRRLDEAKTPADVVGPLVPTAKDGGGLSTS